MATFESVCERMYTMFRACGFPGIGGIADAGDEWVFIEAPTVKGGEIPLGDKPVFVNKQTGETRLMEFDIPDLKKLNHAVEILVPAPYLPRYS